MVPAWEIGVSFCPRAFPSCGGRGFVDRAHRSLISEQEPSTGALPPLWAAASETVQGKKEKTTTGLADGIRIVCKGRNPQEARKPFLQIVLGRAR